MQSSWRLAFALLALFLAGGGAAGCGADETSQKEAPPAAFSPGSTHLLEITLDGYVGPESAGIVMAQELGYFKEVGLLVSMTRSVVPGVAQKYVVDGTVDLGVSHQPQLVLARENGFPIVAVGNVVPQATAAMIWLPKSRIESVADLEGKTVAIPGLPFQRGMLERVLARAGLKSSEVRIKTVNTALVETLEKGGADAIFGGSENLEGEVLKSRGDSPVITSAKELGLPDYDELVFIAREDRFADDPRLIRAFLAAYARGTEAAIAEPERAAKLVLASFEANPELGRRETEAETTATLPLLSRDGYMSPDQARGLVGWLHEEGLIEGTPPASELLTNDYLPPR
jgi:putative hydroxymethylpyrimidine transport system substrate-binding protein